MNDLDVVYASWPEEPYLVAELSVDQSIVATVQWVEASLRVKWDHPAEVDLTGLREVLAAVEARLRANREALDG